MADLKNTGVWSGLPTWAKGTIAVGLTIGVVYVGYKVYKKIGDKKEEKKEEGNITAQAKDNFVNIPTIIGEGAVKSKKGDAYVVKVSDDNKKEYEFDFYSNGRVIISNYKTKSIVARGKYYDSGKIITLDKGKSYSYNSAWTNMQNVLKGL